MKRLVAIDATGSTDFVERLRTTWADGDAVAPIDPRLPLAARHRLLREFRPDRLVCADGTVEAFDNGVAVAPGDALVVATSGTSGEPKGVVLTHDAIAASAEATSARIGVRADDHWLACLPLAHIGGLSVVTRALHHGTMLTVHDRFEPAAVMASGATLVSLVPTALRRIDPSAFRVIVLGGAKPPSDRPVHVLATYGMTETGSGVVYNRVPLDGVGVRIDSDGQIHLRGPMLLRTYRDGTNPKDAAGWFPTGDLGEWSVEDTLLVHGRAGDVIVTGGEKVWPDSVEAALEGFGPLAVAGVPSLEWGAEVTVFIERNDAALPTLDELRERVKATLPAYAAPRRLQIVDAIPRTELGKVRRSELVRLMNG